jgi:protein TonB
MFHYNLKLSNRRIRMLIACFLAIVIHLSIMNFEYHPRPDLAPTVSLPRSVRVFLNQRKMAASPLVQEEKPKTAEHVFEKKTARELKPEKPFRQKVITSKEKEINPPAVEKSKFALKHTEEIEKILLPDPGGSAKAQESATPAERHAVQQNEETTLPGIVQLAYPRYQLNAPPLYPGQARKRGQEGTVILQVLVNEKGRVDALEIEDSSGFGLLDRAAVSSVRKWSFEPGKKGDKRIPMWVRVPVTFKLK